MMRLACERGWASGKCSEQTGKKSENPQKVLPRARGHYLGLLSKWRVWGGGADGNRSRCREIRRDGREVIPTRFCQ